MAFNPNAVAENNGNFVGLPFTRESCKVALYGVPWDVSVSFGEGTASAAKNILQASLQLDLEDFNVPNAWSESAIYFLPIEDTLSKKSMPLRTKAKALIEFLENGGTVHNNPIMERIEQSINEAFNALVDFTYSTTKSLRAEQKLVGLIGGDHSTPFGHIKALCEEHTFGVLQFDAHMDMREAYEGLVHSHASIMHNIMQFDAITKLVQVGIRDYCEEEVQFASNQPARIKTFYEPAVRKSLFEGKTFATFVDDVLAELPELVYISFDIDSLEPGLCPNTGTPVPGGFSFQEMDYFIQRLINSGKKLVGFDLCEVAGEGHLFDGNVGARIAYKLSNALAKMQ